MMTTDSPINRPKKQTIAGGGKYHALTATAKWSSFTKGVSETITHTVAERARRDRDRRERSARAEANQTPQPKG